jgi:hypothetical protein
MSEPRIKNSKLATRNFRPCDSRCAGFEQLGQSLSAYMQKVGPRHKKFARLAEAWAHLLPSELAGHCRIEDFSAGVLTIVVDGPSYMYELRLCTDALLQEVARLCPAVRAKSIRIVMG